MSVLNDIQQHLLISLFLAQFYVSCKVLGIKMYFEYDEKLSDKQISTSKRIYRYRTEKLDIRDSHIQASQMSSQQDRTSFESLS